MIQSPQPSVGSPIRGAIRVTVATSTENVIAGDEFSIFVTVQNPFEVPLTVHRVSTHIPVEFYDVEQRNRIRTLRTLEDQKAELEESARLLGQPSHSSLQRTSSAIGRFFSSLRRLRWMGFEVEFDPTTGAGLAIARDLVPDVTTLETSVSLPLVGRYTVTRHLKAQEPDESRERLMHQIEEERARFERAMDAIRRPDAATLDLQPGNSTTRVFTLRSAKAVWFKPATYRLRIEIEYEIGGLRNTDTVEHILQVKASLASMILGSLLGAAAGFFAQSGQSISLTIASIIGFVTTLILAAMTVVLFARKKDVQPLIAVEDFWGGVAIGFLAAYAGQRLLSSLIPKGA